MNERIKELARQAGFYANPDVEKFEKFAELIRADEREACAEICDLMDQHGWKDASRCALEIRARSEK